MQQNIDNNYPGFQIIFTFFLLFVFVRMHFLSFRFMKNKNAIVKQREKNAIDIVWKKFN